MEHTEHPNPLAMYDLTIPSDRYSKEQLIDFFATNCSRWCFQQERGHETGYEHYQCRISLRSKKRVSTMILWISEKLPGARVSPTVNVVFYTGNEFYVMKEDSRIDGPWSDRINKNINNFQSRFRRDIVWKGWQKEVMDMVDGIPDDRSVNVIVDGNGGHGKSFMCMYLAQMGIAQRVPQQKEARDIMRMILNVDTKKCYFIDLPRATSHRDQQSIYAAIEEIKNGYCYDDRYKFREKYFEPPHVFVFCNELPDRTLISRDRWKIFYLNNDDHLDRLEDAQPRVGLTLNIIR